MNKVSLCFALTLIIWYYQSTALTYSFPVTGNSPTPSPSPNTVYIYDLRYTIKWKLNDLYEEQQFVSALAGLWNRHQPNIIYIGQDIDSTWLELITQPNQWLSKTNFINITSLTNLINIFSPIGVVLYDPTVPSTSMLASTISGSDGLLPVPYRPNETDSLYQRIVVGGPKLPVQMSLVALFNSSGPLLSAKAESYAWSINRQLGSMPPKSDGSILGYYGDYFCASNEPYISDSTAYEKVTVLNHDFIVAQSGIFFDLSPWGDEAPVDDKNQPLGTDVSWFHTLLDAAYNSTYGGMVHMAGFTPWWCKYVGEFSPNNHGGVAAEWETAVITSSYNSYVDADACCIGNMASSSFWQHYPLEERYVQHPPPTRQYLIDTGLLTKSGEVPLKLYYMFYSGDYDSAAWLYSQLLDKWNDSARGSIPIGWPIDPELSIRFPPIFPLMFNTATPLDVIISGDSGSGYLNPTQLYGSARKEVSGKPDGRATWSSWNTAWYRQFGITFSGFIITGDAPQMSSDDQASYFSYSANGLIVQGWPGVQEHLTGNLPVAGQSDIPTNSTQAAAEIATYLPASNATKPRFWMFRSVLTTPTYLKSVSNAASSLTNGNAVVVDPLTLGFLMRVAFGGSNDDRVSYINDTIPSAASAGSQIDVNITIRNDGWNVLNAVNHSIIISVSKIQFVHAAAPAITRLNNFVKLPLTASNRLIDFTRHQRIPANPARADILFKRLALKSVHETNFSLLSAEQLYSNNVSVPFTRNLLLSSTLTLPAKITLPSFDEMKRLCRDCASASYSSLGDDAAAIATLKYEVLVTLNNGSTISFSQMGNIPWETAILLQ